MKTLRDDFLKHGKEREETKIPIYASCPSHNGQCFCTGACRVILKWIDKPKESLEDLKKRSKP